MISLDKIKQAHKEIAPYINLTPLIYSDFLSKHRTVKLKLESLQKTGSFKLRGALNKLLSLSKDQKKKGVVACSTGNHGKGVAYAASVLGITSIGNVMIASFFSYIIIAPNYRINTMGWYNQNFSRTK